MPKASVKVMRSYDYCHFEVCLGTDEDLTLEQVDDLRKDAAKLTDKAVLQYQIMKHAENQRVETRYERSQLEKRVRAIKENIPQSEWSEENKATIKALDDWEWSDYEYQDDWRD